MFPEVLNWCAVRYGMYVIIWCILCAPHTDFGFLEVHYIHPRTSVVNYMDYFVLCYGQTSVISYVGHVL